MMIDTSALVAMLNEVPEAGRFETAVEADHVRLMSTASYLETAIVVETRFGEPGGRELDLWLHRAAVDLVSVDPDQIDANSPIRLNLSGSRGLAGSCRWCSRAIPCDKRPLGMGLWHGVTDGRSRRQA